MKSQPLQILREGRAALDPILSAHGFSFKEGGRAEVVEVRTRAESM
jgi:hypothetical protein